MAEENTGPDGPPPEGDPIGEAIDTAFFTTLESGATPQEAFSAATAAGQAAAAEMGVPAEDFQEGIGAAT
ncbi:MAG: hypothetical protein HON65_13560, partial [Rhodospirillales bacterium]|nr:hypothetical protein [Rhodospirillales bacterium]